MARRLEASHQQAFFQWIKLYPLIDELTFHCPNGGLRTKATAISMKRQGVKPGVPDIQICIPCGNYHGYFIELKSKGLKPTMLQQKMHENLRRNGYKVDVCYSWFEAKDCVLDYLRGTSYAKLRAIS